MVHMISFLVIICMMGGCRLKVASLIVLVVVCSRVATEEDRASAHMGIDGGTISIEGL